MLFRPFTEGSRASCLVHQCHHGSQQDQEHEDTDIPCIRNGIDESVVDHCVQRRNGRKSGIDQRSRNDTDKQ